MKSILLLFLILNFGLLNAQFAPPVGNEGTTAISKDSSVFINWINNGSIQRGYINISEKSLGVVTQGKVENVFGKADNSTVSLGDSGVVVLEFDPPVINGELWDFAVFENSFDDKFLELATVEVSSDGVHYSMFPPVSLTDTSVQIGTYGNLDATKIHNFAGKYRGGYGTPFDLDEIPDIDRLDKNNIRFIKITDVVGSIDPLYCRKDSRGNPINDPFPTPFESGGFDLDAVGVIHQRGFSGLAKYRETPIDIYPSPALDFINVKNELCGKCSISIIDKFGRVVLLDNFKSNRQINISGFTKGLYFIRLYNAENESVKVKAFIKL